MTPSQLVDEGTRLAADLDAASQRYHVKSDQRDILGYESATIAAYVRFLQFGTPVADHLRASSLLGEWGKSHSWQQPDLVQRTAAFHAALRQLGA